MMIFVLLAVDPLVDVYLTDLLLRRREVECGGNVEVHVRCLWINEFFNMLENWVVL